MRTFTITHTLPKEGSFLFYNNNDDDDIVVAQRSLDLTLRE